MWFLVDHDRVALERQAVNDLESCSQWLEVLRWDITNGCLYIDCNITVSTTLYPVCLMYPEVYPDSPPAVRPRNKENWSSHQYGNGGDLCLEIGPDNIGAS